MESVALAVFATCALVLFRIYVVKPLAVEVLRTKLDESALRLKRLDSDAVAMNDPSGTAIVRKLGRLMYGTHVHASEMTFNDYLILKSMALIDGTDKRVSMEADAAQREFDNELDSVRNPILKEQLSGLYSSITLSMMFFWLTTSFAFVVVLVFQAMYLLLTRGSSQQDLRDGAAQLNSRPVREIETATFA